MRLAFYTPYLVRYYSNFFIRDSLYAFSVSMISFDASQDLQSSVEEASDPVVYLLVHSFSQYILNAETQHHAKEPSICVWKAMYSMQLLSKNIMTSGLDSRALS